MKFYKETTDWADSNASNHTYLLSDDRSKMYAYVRVGTSLVKQFKNPIRIDTRGRRFVEVPNTFNYKLPGEDAGKTWSVTGSRGDIYTVTDTADGLVCSCSGFKFRGRCRHVDGIRASLQ